jgi:DNA-binding MarR family transcriptional regulator
VGQQDIQAARDGVDRVDPVDLSVEQWSAQWPELDVSPMQVLGRVHRVFQRYNTQIARVFEAHGINPAAFAVLAALYRSGPPYRLKVSQLADQTLVSTGGMTQRLDRLEQLGLIVRERDHSDRRAVFARLTEQGRERARAAAIAHFENENRMLALLDCDQRAQLAETLRLLEASLARAEQDLPQPQNISRSSG